MTNDFFLSNVQLWIPNISKVPLYNRNIPQITEIWAYCQFQRLMCLQQYEEYGTSVYFHTFRNIFWVWRWYSGSSWKKDDWHDRGTHTTLSIPQSHEIVLYAGNPRSSITNNNIINIPIISMHEIKRLSWSVWKV